MEGRSEDDGGRLILMQTSGTPSCASARKPARLAVIVFKLQFLLPMLLAMASRFTPNAFKLAALNAFLPFRPI